MAIEIRVPTLGESITEATVGKWFKKAGETVRADEPLVELETDKVTLEVNAPGAGVLSEIAAETGQTVVDRRAARPACRRRGGAGRSACAGCGAEGRARARIGDAAGALGRPRSPPSNASTFPASPAAASAARCSRATFWPPPRRPHRPRRRPRLTPPRRSSPRRRPLCPSPRQPRAASRPTTARARSACA